MRILLLFLFYKEQDDEQRTMFNNFIIALFLAAVKAKNIINYLF